MSMFPETEKTMPDAKQMEVMTEAVFSPYAGAANLMAHPAAGVAAASAVGFGLASHALGLWMGALSGMMESTRQLQKMALPEFDRLMPRPDWLDDDSDIGAAAPEPSSPVSRLRSATKTVIADIERSSSDFSKAAAVMATANLGKANPSKSDDAVEKETPGANAAPSVTPTIVTKLVPGLTPEDFMQPVAIEKPETVDDLKKISGIGPKLEAVLNGLGIWTYAQIAAWQPAEIAWVDDYLAFKGRIERDSWLGQASALAKSG